MVSTRQMSTSGGCSSNSNGGSSSSTSNTSAVVNNNAAESARLSVVTRKTSSNYVLVNCSTIPPVPSQCNLMQASTSTAMARHSQLTQAVKERSSESRNLEAVNNAPLDNTQISLLDLPTEILNKIVSYSSYKNIGQLRLVSVQFNDICMHILNTTFSKLISQTFNRFQAIKANMPRRESARRNHPLACECDIIETCYMRLSLLQMTLGKHIERGHCCFFPGAILDEVYTILSYIRNTPHLERPYRVTDELFDLSTMAMEYFRDHIELTLPDIAYFTKNYFQGSNTIKRPTLSINSDLSDNTSNYPSPSPPQSNMVLRKGIRRIKEGMRIYNNQLSVLRNELRTCKRKSAEQGKLIAEQQKLLAEQQKQTLEYTNRLDENDKKNEEMARKFSTLLQELNKCKTELQYWRSKSPAIPICTACGQKISPILPPEDYQALINQGVKPEDIFLNLNADADTNSDVCRYESNAGGSNEFVSPDEATTAKLFAISNVVKGQKRQHEGTPNGNIQSCGINSEITIITAGKEAPVFATDKCTEISSCTHAVTHNMPTSPDNTQCGETKEVVDAFTSNALRNNSNDNNQTSLCTGNGSGYSTKLFYGTNLHKGVIVTPSMLIVKNERGDGMSHNAINENVATASAAVAATNSGSVQSCSTAAEHTFEDVDTLQAITSHETKKARRVQKANRCHLGTASKRSK